MAELQVKIGLDSSQLQSGLQRVEQQVSRLGTVSIATSFRNLASELANANSPAELLGRSMGRLGDLLKGTVFGAAGLAIGKLLAAPFEQVSEIVKDSTDTFDQAIKKLQLSGDSLSFEQAVSEVSMLTQAVDQISDSIKKIDSNPFRQLVSAITGAKKELEAQQATLMQNAGGRMAQGLATEAERARFTQGMTPDEKALFEISERQRKREEQIRKTFAGRWNPAADQAMSESFSLFAQERNAKLDEIKKRATDQQTRDRVAQDQERLRMEQSEKDLENKAYERRRESRRERLREEMQAGLEQAKQILEESKKSGKSVDQIMQERRPAGEVAAERLKAETQERLRNRGRLLTEREKQELGAQSTISYRGMPLVTPPAAKISEEQFFKMKPPQSLVDQFLSQAGQLSPAEQKQTELLNPVQQINGKLDKAVDRLEQLIRQAGTFV